MAIIQARMWMPRALSCVATRCTFIVNRLFSDINVSQGSVATYARCGRIFNNHFTTNLLKNLQIIYFENRLRFDRIMTMRLLHRFWPTLYFAAVSLKTFECSVYGPTSYRQLKNFSTRKKSEYTE